MSLEARLRTVAFGIIGLASVAACAPLPEGPVKAYDGPERPVSQVAILQVSGCAAAIRVNGIDYGRNCNPLYLLPGGDHLVEVEQERSGRGEFNCTQNEVALSWKRDFCEKLERYAGLVRIRLRAGHVYYLGVCKWRQLWIEDLTDDGRVVAGKKPELEPKACPDLRRDALATRG
jgi:hypothetical protein